jgi:type II secretory pathway pseudopilin PulG
MTRRGDSPAGTRHPRGDTGFSLAEVLVATCILATGLVALAALSYLATDATSQAGRMTMCVALASQKLEQLRALAWGYDTLGLPVTDEASDISLTPAASAGGRGLLPSPSGTLASNVPGYVDYLDATGAWVGTGASPPPGTVYVRRWAVGPEPADPANVVLFEVTVHFAARSGNGMASGDPAGVLLAGAKARKCG